MAGMGTGFSKCFILFMAIVILVQGVAYLGLSIWGITFRECPDGVTEFSSNPFKYAMELIYFAQEECGEPVLKVADEEFPLNIDWKTSYAITNREFIFMITYAVISGLWVATSVLVITTLCNRTTKLISGVVYWPWFLSVLCGSILDVVATVYHGIDISHTTSMKDALDYIGVSYSETVSNVWTLMEPFGVYFSTPSILLLCLTSRVAIIWLLNIIGVTFCLSLSGIMAEQNAKSAAVSRSQAPTRQPTPQPAVALVQPVVEATLVESVQPSAPQESPQYPEQIRPKPLPIFIPSEQGAQRPNSQQFAPGDRTTLQSPVMVLPPQVPQQRDVLSPQPDINTYRTTEAHPDHLNYPPSEPQTPRAPSPAVQQLAVTSPLNNRYSEIYPAPVNPRVSEELRNQMPWSYTSMVTKPPPPPRKPQLQVQIYPQIPEPDYADH
ncbi:uncharacterized protein LOC6736514 [Drosophila simulans]|uniref:GD13701 n=1 Tax=Drosophila simulans TaxID=7240 RepID=B4QNK6_DROSI|nr:uncharacterized protein LOC6736514 [Drosophila simulans]XP_016030094.1 uncharacterized protein LOC6736514 [Drosophila simulans]EDX08969.1 GD13701 [Drosophila simulans]KMY97172.1 uncharacterized protein Dsimw501_GD13701, isoform A [Drosophila simulans]KMY97173.1 uncharacterized protein Dsimw501_GD13701, isoform B [Drosophila simulans]